MDREQLLKNFKLNVEVIDTEWDAHDYLDVTDIATDDRGNLHIVGDDMVRAMFAAGQWVKWDVSREPRVQSTDDNDTNDGDDNDGAPPQ